MMSRWASGVLLLLLAVAGCGQEGPPALHVVVWKPNDPTAWDHALARFHEAHPEIRVALEVGPNNSSQLHELLTQKLRARDPSVDAFLMDVVWTPQFARAGWVLPLDERFPPEERAKFFQACVRADTWNDHVWAVPFNTDAGLLYYRKDFLDAIGAKPPETWDEMLRDIATVEEKTGEPTLEGYGGQMKRYEGLVCNMLEFVASNGGRIDEPDAPACVHAVTFVRDRIVGHVAPRGILDWEEQESLDAFRRGDLVFLRSWPYAWAILQASPLAGKVGIARLPHFAGGRSASTLGGWRFGVSAYSRHQDDAWAFVRFMTSEQTQRLFAVEAGKAPARRALYRDTDVLRANPYFADLEPVFETAVPRPESPVYPQISDDLQRFYHAALSDGRSDVPALAREAAGQIRRARERVK